MKQNLLDECKQDALSIQLNKLEELKNKLIGEKKLYMRWLFMGNAIIALSIIYSTNIYAIALAILNIICAFAYEKKAKTTYIAVTNLKREIAELAKQNGIEGF